MPGSQLVVSLESVLGGEKQPCFLISQCGAILQLVLDIHFELFQLLLGDLDMRLAGGTCMVFWEARAKVWDLRSANGHLRRSKRVPSPRRSVLRLMKAS